MIDYQLQAKHWLMLVLLGLTMLLASINPMEFSAYVLHQVGTILMLIVLLLLFKKSRFKLFEFCFLSYLSVDSYFRRALSLFLCAL